MAAAKPEVVLTVEINNIAVKFSRISPILLPKCVAGIIAEHLVYNGICRIQDGGQKTGSSCNFGYITDRNAISNANTMFSRVADRMERPPTPNTI